MVDSGFWGKNSWHLPFQERKELQYAINCSGVLGYRHQGWLSFAANSENLGSKIRWSSFFSKQVSNTADCTGIMDGCMADQGSGFRNLIGPGSSIIIFVQPFPWYLIKVGLWGRGGGVGSLGSFLELGVCMYVRKM